MKIIVILITFFFLVNCSPVQNKVIKEELIQINNNSFVTPKDVLEDFGPFLLPEDRALTSVSLNYYTEAPEPTIIYFSMVGDVDWIRHDNNVENFHKMVFSSLEESAVYEFKIKTSLKNINKQSSVKTSPYGYEYEFDFAIASIEEELIAEKIPHFMVLVSKKSCISQKEFEEFWKKNKGVLSQTIIIPLFDIEMKNNNIMLSRDGFLQIKYKNANLLMIYKNFNNPALLGKMLSKDINDKNYIVLGCPNEEILKTISRLYGNNVEKIYTSGNFFGTNNKIETINKICQIHFNKKNKYVLRTGR